MENGMELLYETTGVILFCAAIALLVFFVNGLQQTNEEVKRNIYDQHAIYMTGEGGTLWIP